MISRQIYSPGAAMHAAGPGPLPGTRIILLAVLFVLSAGARFSLAAELSLMAPSLLSAPDPTAYTPSWEEGFPWSEPAPWVEPVPWTDPVPWRDTVSWPGLAPWVHAVPWPGPVPWPDPVPWLEPLPPTGYFGAFGRRMDKTHAMLERSILRQIIRFDNFFGSVKPEILNQTRYDIRWRNSISLQHGSNVTFGTSFRANINLSKISQRLHLFIAGEEEPGLVTQTLPQDPGNPGFDRTTPTAHFANTELRYELIRGAALNLFAGVGVRLALPFEVFARSRLQYVRNLGSSSIMRFAETFFVKNTDVLGETTEFSLERLFGATTLLRWASAGTASEKIEGVEWGSELSLFRQLSYRSAVTLSAGVFGNSTLSPLVQNYQIHARYRQSFLRNWLFYELEPQVSWPINPDKSRPAILACTFRIEIAFQGTTAY